MIGWKAFNREMNMIKMTLPVCSKCKVYTECIMSGLI